MHARQVENVSITVRFITRMQRYSGKRELRMELLRYPHEAVETITNRLDIPWNDNLEKSVRIFINKQFLEAFIKSGQQLSDNDIIAFIPISGGG